MDNAYHDDCLNILPYMPDACADLIFSDLPFGTTACAWDSIIPLTPLWREFKRVLAPGGCVLLNAAQPFTSVLTVSNLPWFRCEWIWEKPQGTCPMIAEIQPMRVHESILVFAPKKSRYFPQMEEGKPFAAGNWKSGEIGSVYQARESRRGANEGTRYPRSVVRFAQDRGGLHPTQKPVPLCEYFIQTYSEPGNTVLDVSAGSFTTCVAAERANRKWIAIEKDADYFAIGCERMKRAQGKTGLFAESEDV